jgi:hypothetical protein
MPAGTAKNAGEAQISKSGTWVTRCPTSKGLHISSNREVGFDAAKSCILTPGLLALRIFSLTSQGESYARSEDERCWTDVGLDQAPGFNYTRLSYTGCAFRLAVDCRSPSAGPD